MLVTFVNTAAQSERKVVTMPRLNTRKRGTWGVYLLKVSGNDLRFSQKMIIK